VFALVWPAPTAFVLVIVVAAWALADGVAEIVAGFGIGELFFYQNGPWCLP
jgi:hypothetical protein